MKKLGSIFVELKLNDSQFKSAVQKNKQFAESAAKDIEKTSTTSNTRRMKSHVDAESKIRQSSSRTYSQLTQGINSAHLAYNKSLGPQKTFMQQTIATSKHMIQAAPGFAIATAAIAALYGAMRGIGREFARGLGAVENYKLSVVKMAAVITTFSDKATLGDISGAYKEATVYAKDLVQALERLDAQTVATGMDLMTMAETFAQHGVLLDLNNKKAVDGFLATANALKILTAGQNQDIQMRQEINSLMMGTLRHTDRLGKFLDRQVPNLKEQVHQWRMAGTLLENMVPLLEGFNIASKDIEYTWESVGSTMTTIHNKILREAFFDTFESLLGLAKSFNDALFDVSGNLTPLGEGIKETIRLSLNGFGALLKLIGVGGKLFYSLALLPITIGNIKGAFKTLIDFITLRPIGKFLYDEFETVRLSVVALVDFTMKGWIYIKNGGLTAFKLIGNEWNKIMNVMTKKLSEFLMLAAEGMKKIPGMGDIAVSVEETAMQLKTSIVPTTDYKTVLKNAEADLKSDLTKHNKIIDDMVKEASDKTREGGVTPQTGLKSLFGEITDQIEKQEKQQASTSIRELAQIRESQLRKSMEGEITLSMEKWNKLRDVELENQKELIRKSELLEKLSGGSKIAAVENQRANLSEALQKTNKLIIDLESAGQEERAAITKEWTDKEISKREKTLESLASKFDRLKIKILPEKEENKTVKLKNEVDKLVESYAKLGIDILPEVSRLYEELNNKGSDWVEGAKYGLAEYAKQASDVFSSTQNLVTSAFKGMEDALVNFAKTGKINFTDLVDSMITDMIRLVIQQSITGPLAGAASAAIGSYFSQSPAFNSTASATTGNYGPVRSAKGNVFDSPGLSAYSGSIVSSPTVFPFAKGTGLMGEAGPEAILPLERNSQGKLGVVASSGDNSGLNIQINNYGKEKVETRETKTSSGGKNIMIQIGEAIAGDIRNGGVVAGAISGTFNVRPKLAIR